MKRTTLRYVCVIILFNLIASFFPFLTEVMCIFKIEHRSGIRYWLVLIRPWGSVRIELLGTTAPCTCAPKIQEFSSQQCTSSLLCHVILPRRCVKWQWVEMPIVPLGIPPFVLSFLFFLLKSSEVAFLKANRNNNLRTYFPPCSQFRERERELWKQFYLSVQDKKSPCIFQLSFLLLALNHASFSFNL